MINSIAIKIYHHLIREAIFFKKLFLSISSKILKRNNMLDIIFILFLFSPLLSFSNEIFNTKPTTFDNGKLNLIFVRDFERGTKGGLAANLSIEGLNHSLLFGQLLFSLINSNVQKIYTILPSTHLINGFPDITPLQSIENYSLLYENHLNPKGKSHVGTIIATLNHQNTQEIANQISAIIKNNKSGNYIFAMPYEDINQTLKLLQTTQKFTFNTITSNNTHTYMVMEIDQNKNIIVKNYEDNIKSNHNYPVLSTPLSLNPIHDRKCSLLQPQINYMTPDNITPKHINKNEIVYLIRHVEAHPHKLENGNYVCKGQWRALGVVDRLNTIITSDVGYLPDYIYSNNPFVDEPYSENYNRPLTSINPFAIKNNLPIYLPPFSGLTPINLAYFIFTHNSPDNQFSPKENKFSGTKAKPKVILISWESETGTKTIEELIKTIFGQKLPQNFPTLTNNYDNIFKISLDNNGHLKFSNTCEGVVGSVDADDNFSIPSKCPAF